jgi:pyruvate dehydrogenase E2 component (dihydrolipoamide acetyltransferase)
MRKTIASRLQKSYQTAPHFFVEMQVDTAGIDALRAKLKARNNKLSVTAVIVRACADALKKHPNVNATLQDDDLTLWNACNIGVAVALDQGLIVPVIHRAETLSLGATQQQLDNLTARARSNTLHVNDLVDGTFTISNLGMMGVDRFTAIINPPQVAILAVGKASRVFVPDEAGNPVVKSLMTLVLSSDHRVVDGAVAAAFLGDLKTVLEDPTLLLW